MDNIRVIVELYAPFPELLKQEKAEIELTAGTDVRGFLVALVDQFPALRDYTTGKDFREQLLIIRGSTVMYPESILRDGDMLQFLSPLSAG